MVAGGEGRRDGGRERNGGGARDRGIPKRRRCRRGWSRVGGGRENGAGSRRMRRRRVCRGRGEGGGG